MQASATGIEDLDDPYTFFTSCILIIHTIANFLTFMGDMGKAEGMVKSKRSLEHSLLYAKQTKAQFILWMTQAFLCQSNIGIH